MQLANLRHGGAFHASRRTNKDQPDATLPAINRAMKPMMVLAGIIPFQRFKRQPI